MAWLTWQQVGVVLVVAAALAYLVWKMTAGSRPPRRRKGPDVPTSRLTRRKGSRGRGSSSCH